VIPSFNAFGLLPEGIHPATWAEFVRRFGGNNRRDELLQGLLKGLKALRKAQCEVAYVDGSFVTAKAEPGDFDVCYESEPMVFLLLNPVLKDFSNQRSAQKARFGGEFFEADAAATPDGILYREFFQQTKDGKPKGIIALNLKELPE
jgi:hypothetical protein